MSESATEALVHSPVAHAQAIAHVREQIQSCTSCKLHKSASPVSFRGTVPARLSIVGEAPDQHDDEAGAPLSGPSGKLLDQMMRQTLGFDSSECAVFNVVSCWPNIPVHKTQPRGEEFAPPVVVKRNTVRPRNVDARSIDACHNHFMAQLALADSLVVLVLGQPALEAFYSDLVLGQVHGHPVYWPEGSHRRILYPTFHPDVALRQVSAVDAISLDLSYLKLLLDDPDAPFPSTCPCGSVDVEYADSRGLYYCAVCWAKRIAASVAAGSRRARAR